MKIKRTEKRIAPGGCTKWFAENGAKWHDLKAGKTIEVPEDEYEEIKKKFGKSIVEVKEEAKPKPVLTPRKIEDKEGK